MHSASQATRAYVGEAALPLIVRTRFNRRNRLAARSTAGFVSTAWSAGKRIVLRSRYFLLASRAREWLADRSPRFLADHLKRGRSDVPAGLSAELDKDVERPVLGAFVDVNGIGGARAGRAGAGIDLARPAEFVPLHTHPIELSIGDIGRAHRRSFLISPESPDKKQGDSDTKATRRLMVVELGPDRGLTMRTVRRIARAIMGRD